jgi:hypothetical protein
MLIEELMLPCLNKILFGFECMGCGLQRSLVSIYNAEFFEAFQFYPAIYFLIILTFLISVSNLYKFKFHQKLINAFALLSIVTIIINYIIKQLFL